MFQNVISFEHAFLICSEYTCPKKLKPKLGILFLDSSLENVLNVLFLLSGNLLRWLESTGHWKSPISIFWTCLLNWCNPNASWLWFMDQLKPSCQNVIISPLTEILSDSPETYHHPGIINLMQIYGCQITETNLVFLMPDYI